LVIGLPNWLCFHTMKLTKPKIISKKQEIAFLDNLFFILLWSF